MSFPLNINHVLLHYDLRLKSDLVLIYIDIYSHFNLNPILIQSHLSHTDIHIDDMQLQN